MMYVIVNVMHCWPEERSTTRPTRLSSPTCTVLRLSALVLCMCVPRAKMKLGMSEPSIRVQPSNEEAITLPCLQCKPIRTNLQTSPRVSVGLSGTKAVSNIPWFIMNNHLWIDRIIVPRLNSTPVQGVAVWFCDIAACLGVLCMETNHRRQFLSTVFINLTNKNNLSNLINLYLY